MQPKVHLCTPTAPTMDNFDLSGTFVDFQKFRNEGHSFSRFHEPHPGNEEAALAVHLITDSGWTFFSTQTKSCHVRHNPAYTSCLKTGNFWLDSPIFSEMGCYTSEGFIDILGGKSPYLRDFDLPFFREHGACMRYKEQSYWDATHPTLPPPKATPAVKKPDSEASF